MSHSFKVTSALIAGILAANNRTKQELGRRFAYRLGFEPGPRGPDDGVDGLLLRDGQKIHFQSKLSSKELDKDEARKYYSDIAYHQADISIMLAGIGYKDSFSERLYGHTGIKQGSIHLLTLEDLFTRSHKYQTAMQIMPELVRLGEIDRRVFSD